MRGKPLQKLPVCLCLTALLLLSAAGCAGGKADGAICFRFVIDVEPKVIELDDIPDAVKVTVTNRSELEYLGGYHCQVEYYDGEDWIVANYTVANDVGIYIQPGETFELYAQLLPIVNGQIDGYVKGKYRVRYNQWFGEFTIR